MQGNFVRWGKVFCAGLVLGLMGAGSAFAGGITCKPAPLTTPVCTPEPVCSPPPCYQPPVCAPKPYCPPKPVCEWDVCCLRQKGECIVKSLLCLQKKVLTSCKFNVKVYCAAADVITSLVKLAAVVSDCNADYERAICCVENAVCNLEKAVECSGNSEWICAVKEIRCQVKELWNCKKCNTAS